MPRLAVPLSIVLSVLVLTYGNPDPSLKHFRANFSDRRVQLAPHFAQGQTLRYHVETETTADEHMTTPVMDSQQGSNFRQTTNFLIRLDVLGLQPAAAANLSSPSVHFRATFEQSQSDSQTDASTSARASVDDAIDRLEGRSFEFTLNGGSQGDVVGLDQITASKDAAQSALAWIPVLANAGSFPATGIEIGQKWTSEHPLSGFPLAGMTWRSDSTYLRNEPCAIDTAEKATANAPPSQEVCGVILTRFEMSRHSSGHADATPDDYRRNGLRTSGKWTVTGESLNSVSLKDGLLVTSTQTATQDIDYEIFSASSGSRIHQVAHTKTQTDINLVRPSLKQSR